MATPSKLLTTNCLLCTVVEIGSAPLTETLQRDKLHLSVQYTNQVALCYKNHRMIITKQLARYYRHFKLSHLKAKSLCVQSFRMTATSMVHRQIP